MKNCFLGMNMRVNCAIRIFRGGILLWLYYFHSTNFIKENVLSLII